MNNRVIPDSTDSDSDNHDARQNSDGSASSGSARENADAEGPEGSDELQTSPVIINR